MSKLILGTVQFGLNYGINNLTGKPSEEKVFQMLEYAWNHGVNHLDTADEYGTAPQLIGEFIVDTGKKFEVNTKFKGNLSLRTQVMKTLDSLKLDSLNSYFYHTFKDFASYPALLEELVQLRSEKLIGRIGVSVYGNDEFTEVLRSAEVDVVQLPFNLLDNRFQRSELLTEAKQKGKEIHARTVFLQGLFFKPIDLVPDFLRPLVPYLEKLHRLAAEYEFTMDQLALLYVLNQPEIDYAIIGVDNLDQLQYNISLEYRNLPSELMKTINEIQVKEQEIELLYPKNWA